MIAGAAEIYQVRIRRAETLKSEYGFASEILQFYSRICAAQQKLANSLIPVVNRPAQQEGAGLREKIDVDACLPFVTDILKQLVESSPAPLAGHITNFLENSENRRASALQHYVDSAGQDEETHDSRDELLAKIIVTPYAELLAAKGTPVTGGTAGNFCPLCGGRPVVGVLRIEGDGGKRFLVCSFCSHEWEFRRIYCAYCGETREGSLPVFVAEKFPHIRVEACDTCRHCIRTVDLTKDGHAVPIVDDLAAIPLGLWADEFGYERIQGNLLGT